jgi:DNA-binding SARP family transcriptional activator
VAWLWTDTSQASSATFLQSLELALATAMPALPRGWTNASSACAALKGWTGPPPLLIVDDFHLAGGSPAEEIIEQLALRAPLRVVVGTRVVPGFNVSRLGASGVLVELGPDELRFRPWEVDCLFRDVFGTQLPSDELAALTLRTGGWSALLKLFHVSTRDADVHQRRRALPALGSELRPWREYVLRNVVDDTPGRLREFMLTTSVLGRLSSSICDPFLGSSGSDWALRELDRRRLVLPVPGREDEVRYPSSLRSHLRAALIRDLGVARVRERDRRAAAILEDEGAAGEALDAICRAEDWTGLAALVQRQGRRLAEDYSAWAESVPPRVWRASPWLLLGAARSRRADGAFRSAWETYGEAEHARPGAAELRRLAAAERRALSRWLDPDAEPGPNGLGWLRAGTISLPRSAAAQTPRTPEHELAQGLRSLLAGDVESACPVLRRLTERAEASPALVAAASAAEAVALLLSGDSAGADRAEAAAERADSLGLTWLARMSRASLAFRGRAGDLAGCESSRRAFEGCRDDWGTALATFMAGWAALAAGTDPSGPLTRARDMFAQLRAGVLETWALAALALGQARVSDGDARDTATLAQVNARALGVLGAEALACSALAVADPAGAARHSAAAVGLYRQLGLAPPQAPAGDADDQLPSVVVRCFGGFGIEVGGAAVELGSVRPRARQMLRLLALHAGRPVHREVLAEALWPGADVETASRSLHVAVSSLRRALEPHLSRSSPSIIARDGEAYRLALPPRSRIDLLEFDSALSRARSARSRGDHQESVAAYRRALELHHDELLPEDGPSEWLVRERDRRSAEACEAARIIAERLLEEGDAAGAAEVSERGLQLDRYQDRLWRIRIRACQQAGEPAAAQLARREYVHVLQDLGLPVSGGPPGSRQAR